MHKPLTTPVQYLKGIGPKRAKTLGLIGINTIEEALYYFPRRYEDRSKFSKISDLQEGQEYSIQGEILARGGRQSFFRSRFSLVEIAVGDNTGKIFCVWFNQPYLKDLFQVGQKIILFGKVERYSGRLQISAPEFEIIEEGGGEPVNIARIVPVYTLPQGFTQRAFRRLIKGVLDEFIPQVHDFLPYDVRSRSNLLNLAQSLINIHFPENAELQKEAYRRLSFEEFLIFQLPLVLRKLRKQEKKGISHVIDGKLVNNFIASLSYKFTQAQEKVISEIRADMVRPVPMQRLLQGDVGSGKTVVATVAGLMAIQGGYQAVFMAPTEILARQHYINIKDQISPPQTVAGPPRIMAEKIKDKEREPRIGLLVGNMGSKEKAKILKEIKSGKVQLVIGTHALLQGDVVFSRLGLVVVDEQHKFGVGQRALLPQKGGDPDVLIMTATPIPRTLAITLYGDLDVSVINELPPGRLPIKTVVFSHSDKRRAYALVKDEIRQGNQAYIIYPVIEESFALDMAGAKKTFEELKKSEFKDFKVGLIHGKLKQLEQDEIMAAFKDRKLDILMATTVLEVGIDVPSATCMVIENSERFGLSQLHQLRGRIGRADKQSVCVLLSDAKSEDALARHQAMVKYNDGFRIAEEDLNIRGPGEFFGSRQHGLSGLRIGNPLLQMQLLKKAREEALKLLEHDAHLQERPNLLLKEKLIQRFPEYEKLMLVG